MQSSRSSLHNQSHLVPAEMTGMKDRSCSCWISWVYLKLFKAGYYMQSWINHGQLNHSHSKLMLDLWSAWWINLRPWRSICHMQEWSAPRHPTQNIFDLFMCFFSLLSRVVCWLLQMLKLILYLGYISHHAEGLLPCSYVISFRPGGGELNIQSSPQKLNI